MDRYEPIPMRDDMWYDEPAAMDMGRHIAMDNTFDDIDSIGMQSPMSQPFKQALEKTNTFRLAKVLPILPYLAAVVIAMLIWQVGAGPQWFPIRHVKVEGVFQHFSRAEVKEVVMPFVLDGYFHINSYGLKDQLANQAWVSEVEVKRNWPDAISILIKEHQPMVRWQRAGLISRDQQLFFPPHFQAQDWVNLPQLSGPENLWREVLNQYEVLSDLLLGQSFQIKQLHASDRQSWQVTLDNNMQVILGRDNPVGQFKRFLKAYPQMSDRDRQRVRSLDMRYPNGMAVR